MLENMPLSGYAICYGPLALVILGFIAFAALTDTHARRTYLRRLDPRPETERPDDTPLEVAYPVRVYTPTGVPVTLAPAEKASGTGVSELPPSPSEPPPSAVETPPMPDATDVPPNAETPSGASDEITHL
jgi:hypothetical protein